MGRLSRRVSLSVAFAIASFSRAAPAQELRYDLAADSMDIVTNAETGFFRPVPERGDSMVVFRYAAGGFGT